MVAARKKKRTKRVKRTARPLVGGYLERISVVAFEKYHNEITELVKSNHGIYALYKSDRLYYVGLATDLRRRVQQHLQDRHAGKWNRFSLYLVRKVDHIKEIESLLLSIADPRGNKQGGRLRRATNLQKQLRKLMQERSRIEIDGILKPAPRGTKAKRGVGRTKTKRKKTSPDSAARPLKGLFGGKRLYATHKGREYRAIVHRTGRIKFDGNFYDSPSAAGKAAVHHAVNGWYFWKIRKDGELVRLRELR